MYSIVIEYLNIYNSHAHGYSCPTDFGRNSWHIPAASYALNLCGALLSLSSQLSANWRSRSLRASNVREEGIGPSTSVLSGQRSATELLALC